jgi:hypothetical protein
MSSSGVRDAADGDSNDGGGSALGRCRWAGGAGRDGSERGGGGGAGRGGGGGAGGATGSGGTSKPNSPAIDPQLREGRAAGFGLAAGFSRSGGGAAGLGGGVSAAGGVGAGVGIPSDSSSEFQRLGLGESVIVVLCNLEKGSQE